MAGHNRSWAPSGRPNALTHLPHGKRLGCSDEDRPARVPPGAGGRAGRQGCAPALSSDKNVKRAPI
jgi:hypothetical protein